MLLAAGGDCLDDIAVLQADGGLGRLLERQLPSADTLRHFLYAFPDEERIPAARWALFEDRPDETVHCTEVEFTPATGRSGPSPSATSPCGSSGSRASSSPRGPTPSTWPS